MTVATQSEPAAGAPPPVTPQAALEEAVATVAGAAGSWAALPTADRVALLDTLLDDFLAVAPRWVAACERAEGIDPAGPFGGEEWIVGPYLVVRNIRLLRNALADVDRQGHPDVPGPVTVRPGGPLDGQVVAQVFPTSLFDRIFYPGVTGEVWMEPGVTPQSLASTQAVAYGEPPVGRTALVMCAGNVSSIGPMDALYKLFVDRRAVVFKAHPVNAYLGPLLEQAFAALVERGWLRVVYGGAEEGAWLCEHPRIDEIHITGSDRTYEAIVYGSGADGRRRKAERRPRLDKPVTAELGNVSPVIVVPGPWSPGDLAYQAVNLAAMLTNNAGFNCNAARVIVQHAGWHRRRRLLDGLRDTLGATPTRRAWYPGAESRWSDFVTAHPEAELYGPRTRENLPWTLIPGLDPEAAGDVCYRVEAFSGVFAETALDAASPADFVDRAVAWVNERLWGTLNATLIVHPASLRDAATAAAVERAVAGLRYGTVSINHWAAVGYGLVSLPWGGFPGSPPEDIQSGTGWVHNAMLFDRAQKSVVRAPFRARPKPPWFPGHQTARQLGEALTRFEAAPSPLKLPRIGWLAMRG
jgi:acyl-CoA reductase-like NAD-dependent aldehyde dehydrogenase